jgi:asparagine synthase (glutamine-hydrolysing)
MGRYLVFTWRGEAASAQAQRWRERLLAAGGWRPALAREGIEVWTGAGQRLPVRELSGAGPIVLGDLFVREGPVRGAAEVGGLSDQPLEAARRLVAEAWGAYVAFLPDPRTGDWRVLRDPSGSLDAYAWRAGELLAVADDIDGLPFGFAPHRLALDWSAITELFRQPYASHHLAPLAGFTAITPGDLIRLDAPHESPTAIWRPARWVGDVDDVSEADLRAAVRAAVAALAGVQERILLEVSGGFDSAVVAAALAEVGAGAKAVRAVNHYSERREGDERAYAEAACRVGPFRLTTLPQAIEPLVEADFAELAARARPAFAALDPLMDRDLAREAQAVRAGAIFGGQGGDAVFFQMPSAAPIADLLRTQGAWAIRDPFTPGLARWLRRPVWSLLAEAARPPRLPEVPWSWRRFWGPRALDEPVGPPHPWLRELDAAPPGKRVQIASIVGTLESWGRSRRGDVAAVVQPLMSQPVLETCLRIPTWRLLDEGRDRAFARRAFAPWLPSEIANRRAKGALGTLYARRTAASLPFLRAHLIDGVLADAGVLDRAELDRALTRDDLIWRADGARLAWAAMLESWVRYWQGRAPDCAAPRGRWA